MGEPEKAEDKTQDLIVLCTNLSKIIEWSAEAVFYDKVKALSGATWDSDMWDEDMWVDAPEDFGFLVLKKLD